MDEIEWWEFDTAAELAEQVVGDIGFVIESAVGAHGNAGSRYRERVRLRRC
jgi:6-phosphogluconolactonase